ncbi:tyrosine-protein phosphatase 10D-like [Agrilus planipennis]|uniref:Tyrosine-protein phosphatase 10D-like n=1 Tax=Agrilus planipennis TaxID=224129 RepID=A0A7F5R5F1_AGRPL|nr:tyrosine-protein phosphatase 10D-like [Agrilus planipennis]
MSTGLQFFSLLVCLYVVLQVGKISVWATEFVIHIPGNLGQEGVVYRLDYYPPYGYPAPNTTIASKDIQDVIKFSQALPGTKYDFYLYYSNATHNILTWTANFTTGTFYIFIILDCTCIYVGIDT